MRDYAREKAVVMGEMNGHVGVFGERMKWNREMLDDSVDEMNLENLSVTWRARDQKSAIDYVSVNGIIRECVSRVLIDGDAVIDVLCGYNMLGVECCLYARNEREMKREINK